MRWSVVEERGVLVCALLVLRGDRFAGWRCSVGASERVVGAGFIREVCARLRCGALAIAAVRASPRKRKVELVYTALRWRRSVNSSVVVSLDQSVRCVLL